MKLLFRIIVLFSALSATGQVIFNLPGVNFPLSPLDYTPALPSMAFAQVFTVYTTPGACGVNPDCYDPGQAVGARNYQDAINDAMGAKCANNGTIIKLNSANSFLAPATSSWTFTGAQACTGWIQTTATAPTVPAAGTRCNPNAPISNCSGFATITAQWSGHNHVMLASSGGQAPSRLWFGPGLEFQGNANVLTGPLIYLDSGDGTNASSLPDQIIIERNYFTCENANNGFGCQAAVWMAGSNVYVGENWMQGIWYRTNASQQQAISGQTGPGPWHLRNNLIESYGENVGIGGGKPTVPGTRFQPSDITFDYNHIMLRSSALLTPVTGVLGHCNLMEFKSANRLLIQHNVFDNSRREGGSCGQNGGGILINTSMSYYEYATINDVTVAYNLIRHTGNAFNPYGNAISLTDSTDQNLLAAGSNGCVRTNGVTTVSITGNLAASLYTGISIDVLGVSDPSCNIAGARVTASSFGATTALAYSQAGPPIAASAVGAGNGIYTIAFPGATPDGSTLTANAGIVGKQIYCSNFGNAANNGQFSISAVTSSTVTTSNAASVSTGAMGTCAIIPPDIAAGAGSAGGGILRVHFTANRGNRWYAHDNVFLDIQTAWGNGQVLIQSPGYYWIFDHNTIQGNAPHPLTVTFNNCPKTGRTQGALGFCHTGRGFQLTNNLLLGPSTAVVNSYLQATGSAGNYQNIKYWQGGPGETNLIGGYNRDYLGSDMIYTGCNNSLLIAALTGDGATCTLDIKPPNNTCFAGANRGNGMQRYLTPGQSIIVSGATGGSGAWNTTQGIPARILSNLGAQGTACAGGTSCQRITYGCTGNGTATVTSAFVVATGAQPWYSPSEWKFQSNYAVSGPASNQFNTNYSFCAYNLGPNNPTESGAQAATVCPQYYDSTQGAGACTAGNQNCLNLGASGTGLAACFGDGTTFDYTACALQSTSYYAAGQPGQATDGKDIGADITGLAGHLNNDVPNGVVQSGEPN